MSLFIILEVVEVLVIDAAKTLVLAINSITVKMYNRAYEEAAYTEYLIFNLKNEPIKPWFFWSRTLGLKVYHYMLIRTLRCLEKTVDILQAIWESLNN